MIDITGTIDPKIKSLVLLLRNKKVNTFASCQGGEGHEFTRPTIRVDLSGVIDSEIVQDECERIAEIMSQAGYSGFYVKKVDGYPHTSGVQSVDQSYIEIEFWSLDFVPGSTENDYEVIFLNIDQPAAHLRQIRRGRGFSLQDVVDGGVSVSISTLSRMERGDSPIDLDLLRQLGDLYKVSFSIET